MPEECSCKKEALLDEINKIRNMLEITAHRVKWNPNNKFIQEMNWKLDREESNIKLGV